MNASSKAASDPRFTAKNIMNAIDEVVQLSILDKALYRFALIPITKKALLKQKEAFEWTNSRPDWGPGRIDPFNPVKVAVLQKLIPKSASATRSATPTWLRSGTCARAAVWRFTGTA